MKIVQMHPVARKSIKDFPKNVKIELGAFIMGLQLGIEIPIHVIKPMKTIAIGVSELRIKESDGTYRVFYYTKLQDRILIFHAFQKKTQKTEKRDIDIAKKRLKEML
ncbi:MAG: type II toxin-antitoxin system RelE/ParE family toxin [Spirochaetia bacterium]|nr:type II toxin-antitoxin system RelE/ParE family toxin [Spirochaetia bacterium]